MREEYHILSPETRCSSIGNSASSSSQGSAFAGTSGAKTSSQKKREVHPRRIVRESVLYNTGRSCSNTIPSNFSPDFYIIKMYCPNCLRYGTVQYIQKMFWTIATPHIPTLWNNMTCFRDMFKGPIPARQFFGSSHKCKLKPLMRWLSFTHLSFY